MKQHSAQRTQGHQKINTTRSILTPYGLSLFTLAVALIFYHFFVVVPLKNELKEVKADLVSLTNTVNYNANVANQNMANENRYHRYPY